MARRGDISAEDIERLHEQFLSPWRLSSGRDAVSRRLSDQLVSLSATIDEALGSVSTERQALTAEARDLSISSAVTLQRAIQAVDRLMQSAKDSKVRHAMLEAKLDVARREIDAMRTQLDVVRVESQTDPTTGLLSRTRFDRALAKAADGAERERQKLALIVANLDYFADFNANFGRATADRVLRSVGQLLRMHLRPSDIVARLGGDDLAAILPDTSIEEAARVADQFRQVLMGNELVRSASGNLSGRVTVSIGAAAHIAGEASDRLLPRAKDGLAMAKKEGRNRVVVMTPDGPVWTASRVA
jgi:diguanylate cyclase